MPAQWTAEVVGKMHLSGVTAKQLAAKMNVTPEYVSMVLNGHREPEGAKERFLMALNQLIEREKEEKRGDT